MGPDLIGNGKGQAVRSAVLAVLFFVCIGVLVYRAREFSSAAPTERATIAHVTSARHYIYQGGRFNYYSCNYNFSVDRSFYAEHGDCPLWIIDDAVKRRYLGSGAVPTGTDATVYYDPANPSLNSLLEFSAASQSAYRQTAPYICLEALFLLFFVLGRLLDATKKRGSGQVIMNSQRAAVSPNEADSGSEFAERSNSAPQPRLKELYLEAVNRVHPDRAANEADRALRERLMKEANAAFERGDAETLRKVLEEYTDTIPS